MSIGNVTLHHQGLFGVPKTDYILTHTDLLIDGPFLSELSQSAVSIAAREIKD